MMLALESDEVKVGGPIPDEKVILSRFIRQISAVSNAIQTIDSIINIVRKKYKLPERTLLRVVSSKTWWRNVVMCGKYSLTKFANFLIFYVQKLLLFFSRKW